MGGVTDLASCTNLKIFYFLAKIYLDYYLINNRDSDYMPHKKKKKNTPQKKSFFSYILR